MDHKTILKNIPKYSKEEMEKLIKTKTGSQLNTELMKELAGMYNYNLDGTPKANSNNAPETKTESIHKKDAEPVKTIWKDERTFFQKYTFKNIAAEIKHRLTNKTNA